MHFRRTFGHFFEKMLFVWLFGTELEMFEEICQSIALKAYRKCTYSKLSYLKIAANDLPCANLRRRTKMTAQLKMLKETDAQHLFMFHCSESVERVQRNVSRY